MHKLRHKNAVMTRAAQTLFLQPQIGQQPGTKCDTQLAHAALFQTGVYRFDADGLYISMRHVLVRMNNIKATASQALAVPAEPQLVKPPGANRQLRYSDMPEQITRLVEPLRNHGDVALAQHGCGQRHSQAFCTSANF